MFDFEKLEVNKKARNFNRAIRSQVIRCTDLDGSTRSQLTRAGLSVMLNIAEGSGRFPTRTRKTFILLPEVQFLNVLRLLIIYMMTK